MLLASKHFTPVVGIDVHIIITPPFAIPIPLPHPYIGIVFDVADYIPFIGATTFVNFVPRGNATTGGRIGTFVHIPMGGPFLMAPMIGHDSNNFFGSTRVKVEGSYFSVAPYMVMTCNDIGIPLSLAPGKKMKPIPSLYAPTSMSIPLPTGPPVLVGGPYAPDLMAMLQGLVMSYGMGAAMKLGGKILGKGLKALNNKVLKNFDATQGLSSTLCKKGFDPIDLVTGRMIYEGEDFTLPGPIPITWRRTWYSDSPYEGIMGHGVHCNYDIALHIESEEDAIVMRLPDGRVTSFPYLVAENETAYNRFEKLTLTCINGDTYEIYDHNSRQTYTFKKLTNKILRPVSLRNTEGFQIKFHYNINHHLDQIIDCAGRKIDIDVDAAGKVLQVTANHKDEERQLISYEYDDEGNLIKITDALGKSTVMAYRNHLMTKKIDRNGQAFYWKYDGQTTGAKCVETWGDGGVLAGKLEYKDGYNIITNSLDHKSIYYFDENNLCTQVTDPTGGSIYHEYTEYMEPYRDIDEEGNVTGYTYDAKGNLTAVIQPDNSQIAYTYDEKDRLLATTYPEGASILRAFDDTDKLLAVIGLDGDVTSFKYNSEGQISSVRDGKGNFTKLEYDEDLNLSKMTLPNDAVSKWQYDSWGRCTKTLNPEGHEQRFFYDELDRINKIQQTDNNVIDLKYNAYDEVIQTRDRTKAVNFEYTALGSLKMREENSVKVHFDYNTEEELLSITNEHEEKYVFNRNEKGEITVENGFDGLTRFYDRDLAGKVVRVKRPSDKFTEYEYDLNGRITRAEHSDGTWSTFTYNRDGRIIEAANENSLVQMMRDPSGKILTEIQDGYKVESTYDKLGNRVKIKSSLGANIDVQRDNLGFIKEVNASVEKENEGEEAPENQQVWTAKFNYNSLGMEVERMLPGGIVSTFEYDQAGRPIRQKVSAGNRELRHRTYKWNVNDRLTTMVNQLTSGKVTYTHDDFGNLASAQYENGNLDYKLPDEVGNLYRTKKKKDRKYGRGGQLLEADGKRFEYDDEGNLIKKTTPKGTWQYDWYGNGMLKSVDCPTGQEVSFEYDALGRRTAKIVKDTAFGNTEPNGKITRFIWDGNVPLHEWHYALKDRPKLVVDELGFLVKDREELINQLITWVFDEGTFKPAAKIVDGEQYSIITDYLGTPVEMYNSKGEKTWHVEYDIYGKIRKLMRGNPAACPFRYQGQYEDAETGLYYNRFRYYSADEGVYISQDPIKIHGKNPNLYAYTRDVNILIDIFGLGPIFRGMKDDGGKPKIEPSARGLGARPGTGPRTDIPVDSNGMVHPDTGGISASPTPDDLPKHRKPPEFGGTGKDPVWKIDTDELGDNLKYVPDKPGHGTIQPSKSMTLDEYQKALANLQDKFKKVPCP